MPNWSEKGHVLATCDDSIVYCRVVGYGNMNNCAPFQESSTELQQQGYRQFIVDFSRCEGLDSTFLGILLGMAVGLNDEPSRVMIVNASDAIVKILSEVGIDCLLEVCREKVTLPDVPMQRLEPVERGREQRAAMILKAHENLCRIREENQERFGRFVKILREELESSESGRHTDSKRGHPDAGHG